MRNYKQVDTQEKTDERIKKRDVFSVIFAIAGITALIWGLI